MGIKLLLDCGFVPCMFGTADTSLLEHSKNPMGICCGPIPDILHDGTLIPCYPCASLSRSPISAFDSLKDTKVRLSEKLLSYSQIGIFKECNECLLRLSGKCLGGCRGTALRRMQQARFRVDANLSMTTVSRKRVVIKDASEPEKTEIKTKKPWSIPYVDQPLDFWNKLAEHYGEHIQYVYLPLPCDGLGSGRPKQPDLHMEEFMQSSVFPLSVLINPLLLQRPVEEMAPALLRALDHTMGKSRVGSVTLTNVALAAKIKQRFPHLPLTASVLMDIFSLAQLPMIEDHFDTIVVSSRIMRSLPALEALRMAWKGKLSLIVNEGCLPGCVYRMQHFYEMSTETPFPQSLCAEILKKEPWLRLTGSWVLPQHLHLFDIVIDGYKLDGRVTLQNTEKYLRVLNAYINRSDLMPHEIGGGPASVTKPIDITDDFFTNTLSCNKNCGTCSVCRDFFDIV